MTRANKIILIFILLMSMFSIRQVFAAVTPESDVRIVIDVSGSMKKNDPKNLRAPGLEMIVGLLPAGSKAGVWTFAKYVNMVVPHREVNKQWRADAQKQAPKIHSKGLFTNIEQALKKATVNQTKAASGLRRSVILLSDGLVDISSDPKASITSRQRILTEIVPRLKKANIVVHTIALSGDADQALLREIALETDGWYEQVNDAEQLQKVFLHLFEKATNRDSLPLTDNHFKIDDSISEMTVLVFRQPDSKPTELRRPDQSKISVNSQLDTVRWQHSDTGYDLITVTNPQRGAWTIDADLDPNNRVMVLTDLKLKTTDLPNNILIGEAFDFDVSMTNHDKMIKRQDFLKLLNVKLTHENEVMTVIEESLNASQGNYRTQVGDTFQPGRNDIVTIVTSGTFERQRRQSINVVEMPFVINTEQLLDETTRTHRLTLTPDTSLIDTKNMSIAAMLTAEDGSEWAYDVLPSVNNSWQLTLAELEVGQRYTLSLQIKSQTLKGRPLFLQAKPIELKDETQSTLTSEADIAQQVTDELALLADNERSENDELAALDLLDGLSPIAENEVVDELAGDIANLLPESAADDLGLADNGIQIDDVGDKSDALSTSILLIGNGILLLMVAIGFFLWRRKMAAIPNPGVEL